MLNLALDLAALQHGLGVTDAGLVANRLALGTFFAISGYHKLFVAERHKALVETMKANNIPLVPFNCWFVPFVEFFGGLALISGVLAPLAATGLFMICLVATCTDGIRRVASYQPIDKADYLDDLLYLPEVLYMLGLAIVIIAGPGSMTLLTLL